MNTHRLATGTTATLAILSIAAALGLAACDRAQTQGQAGNPPPTTVGQKIDTAIDRTQQKIAEAGDKTAQTLSEAGDKTMQKLSEAGQKTEQALSNAADAVGANTTTTTATTTADASRVMNDAAITASIKTDFLKDPDLSVLKIDVDTKGGVVTLNGLAGDEPARQRAEKMASSVKGVKEVRNFLVVKRA